MILPSEVENPRYSTPALSSDLVKFSMSFDMLDVGLPHI
jgi:hypothetical protein